MLSEVRLVFTGLNSAIIYPYSNVLSDSGKSQDYYRRPQDQAVPDKNAETMAGEKTQ
jgi:hypothetical protein